MKIVAVVPMKLNNSRLPQKNIRPFTNGRPLCYYILNTLLKCNKIDDVYVYCSNPNIINYIPSGVKYLRRSESLDQDSTKMNEVLHSFSKEVVADIYVLAHTTAPFVSVESIDKGLKAVIMEGYDSSFSAKKLQDFLWKDEQPFNYDLDNIPRTQDLEAYYEETSGFYIFKNSVITENNRRIGNKPFVVEVSEIEAIDIDELEDFKVADAIYNFYYKEDFIKNDKVKVLDCTLRDGGYVNSWKFGTNSISKVINGLTLSGIDFIECGFVTNKEDYVQGSTKFNNILDVNTFLPKNTNSNYAVMINYGQYDIDDIPIYNGTGVNCIRVAFHKKDLLSSIDFCKKIISKGYKVFVQAMVSLSYTDLEFKHLIQKCNEINPYSLYIVDSFGVMKKNEVLHYYKLLETELNESILIGFHAHNNLQLAYSNAIALLECSRREIIIDSSIHGMGRGAGNLNTEILIEHINDCKYGNYKLKPILEVSDSVIEKIYSKHHWGYSLPNYLSAKYNCHPNYSSYLNEKNNLTLNDINSIFEMLEQDKKLEFDKTYIENLYESYLESKNRVNDDFERIKHIFENKEVIMICPGKTSIEKIDVLKKDLHGDKIVVSINFKYSYIDVDYVFIGNNKRMQEFEKNSFNRVIATTNIPDNDLFAKINYSLLLVDNPNVRDNSGLMFIKLMYLCKVKSLLIVGMDKYSYNFSDNYINDDLAFYENKEKIDNMNFGISEQIDKFKKLVNIEFLK